MHNHINGIEIKIHWLKHIICDRNKQQNQANNKSNGRIYARNTRQDQPNSIELNCKIYERNQNSEWNRYYGSNNGYTTKYIKEPNHKYIYQIYILVENTRNCW